MADDFKAGAVRAVVMLGDDLGRSRARLAQVPQSPGVYLFRDPAGKVVYVGKAVRLQDRLRAYLDGGDSAKEQAIMAAAGDFEYLLAGSEVEALTTEASLIQHYRPRFNIRLRDERDFLYFKIPSGEFPPLEVVHRRQGPGRYFGPYTSWAEVRRILGVIKRNLPYRACSDEEMRSGRPCHDYLIGRCAGVCVGAMDTVAYARRLEEIAMFLEGKAKALQRRLRAEMEASAEELAFERAARLRDQLQVVEEMGAGQRKVGSEAEEEDLVGLYLTGSRAGVMVAKVRGGRVVGQESFTLEAAGEGDPGEAMRAFLLDYYGRASEVPRLVATVPAAAEAEVVGQWLGQQAGRRVRLSAPARGRRKRLVGQLQQSAKERLLQMEIRDDERQRRAMEALGSLQQGLGLEVLPRRIECYDVSHIQGAAPVGSMVVFNEGLAAKSDYRSFRIQGEWPDDTSRQAEMMRRRLGRLAEGKDRSFGQTPDLMIIDGGAGQLSAVRGVLAEMHQEVIQVVALAKAEEEFYIPGRPFPLRLKPGSSGLFLAQRIRDEAHRFAISQHRKLRGKKALASPLDSVHGLGPVGKRKLLRRFGSLEGIQQAGEEAWGLPEKVATSLREVLAASAAV